tara:strand:+ start:29 stop:649 length:621 start_codon:yes stop_codon:yes gene_type:complete
MRHFSVIFFTVGFLFSTGFSSLKAEDEEILSSEVHCVAYTTPEKILFFPDYLVIGKSCKVQAWAEINENQSRFIVTIPVKSFDSGVSARDDDVMEILEADNYQNIRFETDWLSKVEIKKILLDGKGEVNGVLMVSGRDYSISLNMIFSRKGKNYSIRGTFESNYTFFDLSPPTLGIFAEVLNILKIVVNLQSDQITGFKKIINQGS